MATLTENITYLQPNSFRLVVERQNYPNLEFFCQSVVHPGVQIGTPELSWRNVSPIPLGGDKFIFGELDVTVIIDEDMRVYSEIFDWLNRIVQLNNVSAVERQNTEITTAADITLLVLSSNNNVTRKIRYIDAVPTGIGNIEFQATTTGTEYLTVPISFRYSYFEII